MNTLLLLFFALPVATIILSVVLLKVLKCPWLVAATFFAIYLVLTYAVVGSDFLILAIVYTILSYITAIITRAICKIITRINNCNSCDDCDDCNYCDSFSRNRTGRIGENQNCCNGINNLNTANNQLQNTNTNAQAQFTVTTNQANPVLLLGNRNNTERRQNCCFCRRR